MAGSLTTFQNGTNLKIKIGDLVIGYAQNFYFSENMSRQMTKGIGTVGPIESVPLIYNASGGFSIQSYSSKIIDKIKANRAGANVLPKVYGQDNPNGPLDGNNLNFLEFFSPLHLFLNRKFDIEMSGALPVPITDQNGLQHNLTVFTMKNALMSSYSSNDSAASVSGESYTFVCDIVIDHANEPRKLLIAGN